MNQNNPIVVYVQEPRFTRRSCSKERLKGIKLHSTPKTQGNAKSNITIVMGPTWSPRYASAHVVQCKMSWLLTRPHQPESFRNFSIRHVAAEAAGRLGRRRISGARVGVTFTAPVRRTWVLNTCASCVSRGVVVAVTGRLEELHGQVNVELDLLASNDGADNQSKEDDEDDEIQDGVTDDPALAKLGLLERVDGRTDLTTVLD